MPRTALILPTFRASTPRPSTRNGPSRPSASTVPGSAEEALAAVDEAVELVAEGRV